MDLGPHASFIWSAYAVVVLAIGGLIGWLFMDGRQRALELEALERQGARRRPASKSLPELK